MVEWLRHQRAAQVAEQDRRADTEHPETDDELARAEENAQRLVDAEPWQRWRITAVPEALLVRNRGALGPRQHELCSTHDAMAGC